MSSDGGSGRAGRDTDVSGAEAVATGAKTYSDWNIKREKKDFIESGANKIDRGVGGPPAVQIVGGALSGPFQAGSIATRTYFDEKVLTGKRTKQNIGYTQEEFRNLSLTKQNEVYGNYMENRLSGKTDAYGNPIGGWRQEEVKHRKADGTMTTKKQWVGGNNNDNRMQKSTFQLEQENRAAEEAKAKAESEAKEQAATEQADAYKKKRLSLVGGRSLFARPGGRGFFN